MIKLTIIGNLGKDAVVRDTNGQNCISFSVAHTEKYTDKEGVKHEKATWVNCAIWRKADQSIEIAKYLLKGVKVYLEGQPTANIYTDQQGGQLPQLNLRVTQVELLGGNKEKETNTSSSTNGTTEPAVADLPMDMKDDLPF